MPDQEPPKKPDSRFAAYLTALAAFIAAMMPLTASINGRYSVEVEREKFNKQLQLSYIDRALDTSRDPAYRESFLRFLVEATTDSPDSLHQWAMREITKTSELTKLQNELANLDTLRKATAAQLAKEQNNRSQDKAPMSLRQQELSRQFEKAEEDRARLVLTLREAERRSGAVAPNTDIFGKLWRLNITYGKDADHSVRSETAPTEIGLRFTRSNDRYVVWKIVNDQAASSANADVTRAVRGTALHIQFRFDDLIPSGSSPFCKYALSSHGALFDLDFDPENLTLSGVVKVAHPDQVSPYVCAFVEPTPR